MRKHIETASNAVGAVLLVLVVLVLFVAVPELQRQNGDTVTLESGRQVTTDAYTGLFLLLGGALVLGFARNKTALTMALLAFAAFIWLALTM